MHDERNLRENNRGFTLIELIVTVVILALVTAPFLSSFVSASKTNLKSKRTEEANELGALIIEQFKGSSIDFMKAEYGLATADYYVPGGTDDYLKKTSSYSVAGKTLTGPYANYKVDVSLTPSNVIVNSDDAIPEIDKLDRTKCVVLVDNLTKFDITTTKRRKIVVTIDYNSSSQQFYVEANVATLNSANTQVSGKLMHWDFDTIPSVYMLYKPKDATDIIEINNYIDSIDYSNYNSTLPAGTEPLHEDTDKVNIYLINQKNYTDPANPAYYIGLDGSTVKFREGSSASAQKSLKELFMRTAAGKNEGSVLSHTVIYSNIWETAYSSTALISDKDDTVNGAIKMKKLDTVYDLDVTVYYGTDKISEYHSSKMAGN